MVFKQHWYNFYLLYSRQQAVSSWAVQRDAFCSQSSCFPVGSRYPKGKNSESMVGNMNVGQQHVRISELQKLLWLKFSEDMHLNSFSYSCFTHLNLIWFPVVVSPKTQNKFMLRMYKNMFIYFFSLTRLSEMNISLNPLTEGICHMTHR